MKFEKIKYQDLKPKQKEIYNFQKVSGLLAGYGYTCIKLADDWCGADFLAYKFDGNETLNVQLKGRITIDKKYKNAANLYMAFRNRGNWYLVPHEKLIEIIRQVSPKWLLSNSWLTGGSYSAANSKKLAAAMVDFKL